MASEAEDVMVGENPLHADDIKGENPLQANQGESAAASATVIAECVVNDPESAAAFDAKQKEMAESMTMDAASLARERRWTIAENKLSGMTMCSPNSAFRMHWDIIQVVLLLYVAVVVPYRIGFTQDTKPGDFFFALDALFDFYFALDIILSFRTGFVDSRGELQWKTHAISVNYFKGWFIIDVSSCLPTSYIGLVTDMDMSSADARSNKMLRLIRLLRLLKLLRLMRVGRIMGRFSLSDGFEAEFHALITAMKLGKLMLIILWMGHWLGCAWYYTGDIVNKFNCENEPNSCDVKPDGTRMQGWVEITFGDTDHLASDRSYVDRYLYSLYWSIMTMTTVGYGNNAATTIYEIVCAVIGMMGGGFIFGAIVGNLSEFSRRANPGKNKGDKQNGLLRAFMLERGVSSRLMKRITLWYMGHLGHHTAMESKDLLLKMPVPIRDTLMVELGYATGKSKSDAIQFSIVHKVPFLADLDNASLIRISLKLCYERFSYLALDELEDQDDFSARDNQMMMENTPARWMTILCEGSAQISKGDEILGEVQPGDFFGETSILRYPDDIISGVPPPDYERTATATSNCVMHTLSGETFAALCLERPAILRHARPYIERLGNSRPGRAPDHEAKQLENMVNSLESRMGRVERSLEKQHGETMDRLKRLIA